MAPLSPRGRPPATRRRKGSWCSRQTWTNMHSGRNHAISRALPENDVYKLHLILFGGRSGHSRGGLSSGGEFFFFFQPTFAIFCLSFLVLLMKWRASRPLRRLDRPRQDSLASQPRSEKNKANLHQHFCDPLKEDFFSDTSRESWLLCLKKGNCLANQNLKGYFFFAAAATSMSSSVGGQNGGRQRSWKSERGEKRMDRSSKLESA